MPQNPTLSPKWPRSGVTFHSCFFFNFSLSLSLSHPILLLFSFLSRKHEIEISKVEKQEIYKLHFLVSWESE